MNIYEYCLSSILPVALLIFIYLPFSIPRDVRVILGACRTCDVSADKDSSLVFFADIMDEKTVASFFANIEDEDTWGE